MLRRGGFIVMGLVAALLSGCGPTAEEQRATSKNAPASAFSLELMPSPTA